MDSNKEKLRKKLRKKQENRINGSSNPTDSFNISSLGGGSGEPDILKMMDHVNKILKTNPQMIQQISKCVSNVMSNQELMDSLTGQITNHDQTLESNSLGES